MTSSLLITSLYAPFPDFVGIVTFNSLSLISFTKTLPLMRLLPLRYLIVEFAIVNGTRRVTCLLSFLIVTLRVTEAN